MAFTTRAPCATSGVASRPRVFSTLDPLSPGGSGRYRVALFDHRTDAAATATEQQAAAGAILVLDGIFLHRDELRSYWDFSIFLDVGFEFSIPRCAARDGSSPDPQAAANHRYVAGQQLYLQRCQPREHATLVVNNEALAAPFIVTQR
jgi:uridine kinase